MEPTEIAAAIEAIVMVADAPVEPAVLAQLLEVSRDTIEATCDELAEGYRAQGRGFVLARVAGGYRFQSHPDQAPFVERFVLEGQSSRLSAAALETLAIIAYKQPISRMQIAAIRGVSVDGVLRTLQQRGYVDEVARDPGPGNASLFGTTASFCERLGIDSPGDLPPLIDFVPGVDVVEALEQGLRPEPLVAPSTEAADTDDSDRSDDAVEPDVPTGEPEESVVETLAPDGPAVDAELTATDAGESITEAEEHLPARLDAGGPEDSSAGATWPDPGGS
ncbi:MAG: SMC-Scp complex subunit ScpB [Acidimicrobiales bacterium]